MLHQEKIGKAMTQHHDSEARLAMLRDTIDRNRDKLSNHHEFDMEKDSKKEKTADK